MTSPILAQPTKADLQLADNAEIVKQSEDVSELDAIAPLQQQLQSQNWAAADRETRRLLAPDSVSTRPDTSATVTPALIRAIDQAWLAASDGRFGLSVQLRLWQAAQAAIPTTGMRP